MVGRLTRGFEGRFCQGGRCWGSRVDVKDGARCRAVDSVDTSARNDRRRVRVAGSSWRGEIRSVLSVVLGVVRSVNAKYRSCQQVPKAQRLRALQWSWDSDTESDEEGPHVIRRLEAQSIDTDDPHVAQSSLLRRICAATHVHPGESCWSHSPREGHLHPSRTCKFPLHP